MRVALIDSLEKLYPDSDVSQVPSVAALDVPRGGTVAAQVLLNDLPPGEAVSFSIGLYDHVVEGAKWFRLIDVPVEANTGLSVFIEKPGEPNPHVARRAPFRVYDAMEPVRSPVPAGAATMALRMELPITAKHRPGQRRYSIKIRCGGRQAQLLLTVTVHKALVPPTGKDSLPYTNWFSLVLMAQRHDLPIWSPAHWRMIGHYAKLMAHARQNTFCIPWGDIFTRTRQGLVLNRPRLRRIVKVFTAAGLYWIEGGHVAHRTGRQWTATTFDISLDGPRATSVEGNVDLAKACRQLMEEIDRNGWRGRWIQHVTDEPTAENAADYRILVGMVRKYMPGLPILDATMDTTLAGAVDIWCPQCQEYQKHRELFKAQRALGDRVWFYTCCAPGGPWLNRLLDQELLRPALFGWAAALFDLDGFLHWGLNHYKPGQDPFQKSVVEHANNNLLPAGDTHIVYPGKGRPYSSLRLEAQREGFEDYQLLMRLKARRAKLAQGIIAKAIRGFDHYTKDVPVFRAAQKALWTALDAARSSERV